MGINSTSYQDAYKIVGHTVIIKEGEGEEEGEEFPMVDVDISGNGSHQGNASFQAILDENLTEEGSYLIFTPLTAQGPEAPPKPRVLMPLVTRVQITCLGHPIFRKNDLVESEAISKIERQIINHDLYNMGILRNWNRMTRNKLEFF